MTTQMTARKTIKSRGAGFSLIEILVAMAIVAILAAFAYPSFVQSIRKSKRTDAHTALTKVASNLERFFGANGTYTTDTSQLGLLIDAGTAYSDASHYVITVAAGASGIGSSYIVSASAASGSIQAGDTGCTNLSLDSLGRRLPSPATSKCW
ncbi:MAG: hypothetical protein BMS9Abin32_520 [Gammaproteobacteria bacterium]|nr:MAG: hypothetical protein BMS9Abin32_520 [Gammaproteobacteria bacterium]